MTGLSSVLKTRGLMLLGCAALLTSVGCQSDNAWQFAQRNACGQVMPLDTNGPEALAYQAAKEPLVVRGQYSTDAGTSTPSLWPDSSTANSSSAGARPSYTLPAASSPYGTTGSGGTASTNTASFPPASTDTSNGYVFSSPSSAPPAGSNTAPQTVQPNPQLGSEENAWPRVVPPITGDAAGMGPYEPNRAPDASLYPSLFGEPTQEIPINVYGEETMTGRIMFGVGVNSDAGMVGSIVLDEQNFNWQRWPTSFEDIRSGRAWRGGGQRFRVEAVPGTELQRYMVSFQEPYWLNSQVSFGASANYYTRQYTDWSEERLGGRIALGYHFTHALTGSLAFRGESVTVFDLADPAPAVLEDAKGTSGLYGFQAQLAHDTRDSQFMPTEGHLIEFSFEQVIGTYEYPQMNLNLRRYFMLHERPDGSGRHVLSLSSQFGWTDSDTPIYEHYFAGGFSTIRGFDFRGASPRDPATGVFVGGHFMMLASAEYLFPITADDMLRGVIFCDTGTVEPSINDWSDKYRVAPGFGLRITVPAMGPAPIALDFAFPISHQDGDLLETFSFFVGLMR